MYCALAGFEVPKKGYDDKFTSDDYISIYHWAVKKNGSGLNSILSGATVSFTKSELRFCLDKLEFPNRSLEQQLHTYALELLENVSNSCR